MNGSRYKAFISYSHADDQWATWLHRSLESYRPPKRLVGEKTRFGEVPARLSPIFRDREELPSATDLGAVINEALEQSECQIVLCSPAAARSKWVNEEIKAFKRLGREDRIFCLIVDGEPNASDLPGREAEECFPPAVRFALDASGELSDRRAEPIAADARANKDGKPNARLKLIAGVLGVGFDALAQREMHRRQRRTAVIAAASVVGMLVTSGLAVSALLARAEAESQRERAEQEAETAKQTTSFLVDLFSDSDPSEARGNTITVREVLDRGAERINRELTDQPAIQTTLMQTIGSVYTSLGLLPPAVTLLREALEKRIALYGENDLEVASVLASLARVLMYQAAYEESEHSYREAIRIRTAQLGEDDVSVADLDAELADLLGRTGNFEAAEPLIRRALELHRDIAGDSSPEVAEDLEGLAVNLYNQGDLTGSVELLREAADLRRRIHGGPHPDLAEALNNLALVLRTVGEYQESLELFEEALEMKRVLLGDSHPEIAMGLSNIASALHDQGELERAESMYREALAMQRDLLGERHPDIALTLNNLAFLLYDEGDRDGAMAMLRESLDMFRAVLGDEHPSVAVTMANLGMWLTESGNFAAAEPLLRSALDLRRSLLGDEHPDVADSMTLLADLLIQTGRYEEALEMATQATAIGSSALSPTHWRTASAMSTQGAALTELGDYEDAEPLLLQSSDILSHDPGSLPIVLTSVRRRLVRLYELWGLPDRADDYIELLGASGP